MADEPLDGLVAAEPVAAPAEGGEGEPTNEQPPNPVEALASEMGWVPQDQYRGDAADWKPADEFIKAGRDITRSVTRKLHSMEEQLSRVGQATSQVIADKIAERDAYWQNRHAKAVEDGDQATAKEAVDALVQLKAQAPANGEPLEPPETLQFKERHKAWFGVNRLATGRAMEVAERSRQLGATIAEQLQDAEDAVRREFTDLFPAPAKRPAAVQTGGARNGGGGSSKKGFADMPPESQAVARDFLARHGVPLEKTAASYWADIEKNERKVG